MFIRVKKNFFLINVYIFFSKAADEEVERALDQALEAGYRYINIHYNHVFF